MDAYVGFRYDGRGKYGLASDWSDSYFAGDPDTFDSLIWRTEGALDYSYNVDIKWLDPNKKTISVHSSGSGLIGTVPCNYTLTSHEWAHEFYRKTIPPETVFGAEGFGFPVSKEGGNWDLATKTYVPDKNSSFIKVLGRPDSDCATLGKTLSPIYSGQSVDFAKVETTVSAPGIVNNRGSGLIITSSEKLAQRSLQSLRKNGSPDFSSGWIGASITVTNPINFVSFEAEFTNADAQGLLTAYWETESIGSIDERAVLSRIQRYTYMLPATAPSASYTLGFRLDSFANTVSTIAITNVAFGFIGLRDSISLTASLSKTDKSPLLSLTGPSGYVYRVESSTNLVNWSTTAILVNTNGTVRFAAPNSKDVAASYYRAVAP